MIIIAHRSNIGGPNPEVENNPEQIDKCISIGYDVEIDLRYDSTNSTLWLGHDIPQYKITWDWLESRSNNLWIHCKDIETLHEMLVNSYNYNYFWHNQDDYTLTSKKIIWAYPGKVFTNNTVVVMPEWDKFNWEEIKKYNCYGICTDYPEKLK